MMYKWADGKMTISVSVCSVRHAVNTEGHRPLGRKLTDDEIAFVHANISSEKLLAAYESAPDANTLPYGTAANLYNISMNIDETIKSTATL